VSGTEPCLLDAFGFVDASRCVTRGLGLTDDIKDPD
jgi:hypothetical protein